MKNLVWKIYQNSYKKIYDGTIFYSKVTNIGLKNFPLEVVSHEFCEMLQNRYTV